MAIKGITITFTKQVQSGTDAMNNPIMTTEDISVENCLIAPIIEPTNIREQQAMEQSKDQVRIHLPKTYTGDVSDSTVIWDGKTFKVDSTNVKFMDDLVPGQWNRYFRAEAINE